MGRAAGQGHAEWIECRRTMHTDVLNECRRAVGCASPGMRRKAKWREAVLLLATGESRPNEWLLDNASHGRYSDYRFDEGVEERRAPGRGGGASEVGRSWSLNEDLTKALSGPRIELNSSECCCEGAAVRDEGYSPCGLITYGTAEFP